MAKQVLADDVDDVSRRQPALPDMGSAPDTIKRHCTDPWWSLVTIFFLAAWIFSVGRAFGCSDLRRDIAFADGDNKLCLPEGSTPFLFFCRNSSGKLDLERPICRESCPTNSSSSVRSCGAGPSNDGVLDYPTVEFHSMVCLPASETGDELQDMELRNFRSGAEIKAHACTVLSWLVPLLATCIPLTILTNYAGMYIMRDHASDLMRTGLCVLACSCFISAAVLTFAPGWVGDDFEKGWFNTTMAPSWLGHDFEKGWFNTPMAGALALVGAFLMSILVCAGDTIETAGDLIELGCECVLDRPTLILQPLLSSLLHTLNTFVSVYAWILNSTCERRHVVFDIFGRSLECRMYFALILLSSYQLHQIISASSEFVVSYAAVIWYLDTNGEILDPRRRSCLLGKSYWAGLRYHFGTLAKGQLMVGYSRIVRMVLNCLVGWTLLNNPISRCFRPCCCFCYGFHKSLKMMCKNAYIDVAMTGRPFLAAAEAFETLADHHSEAIYILSGATWVFQVFGVCTSTALGAFVMFVYAAIAGEPYGVQIVLVCSGAFASFGTATLLMLTFDTVSNAILYCSVVDKLQQEAAGVQEAPSSSLGRLARICACLSREDMLEDGLEASQEGFELDDERSSVVDPSPRWTPRMEAEALLESRQTRPLAGHATGWPPAAAAGWPPTAATNPFNGASGGHTDARSGRSKGRGKGTQLRRAPTASEEIANWSAAVAVAGAGARPRDAR